MGVVKSSHYEAKPRSDSTKPLLHGMRHTTNTKAEEKEDAALGGLLLWIMFAVDFLMGFFKINPKGLRILLLCAPPLRKWKALYACKTSAHRRIKHLRINEGAAQLMKSGNECRKASRRNGPPQ